MPGRNGARVSPNTIAEKIRTTFFLGILRQLLGQPKRLLPS